MSVVVALGLALWAALALASSAVWLWPRSRSSRPPLSRTPVLIAVVVVEVLLTGVVALHAAVGGPVGPPWSWLVVGVAAVAAVLCGGAVTTGVLGLADATSRPGSVRVQRTVLRGGTWIGALERLALLATLLAGWPDGLVAIVAVKAFARYPELKSGQASGAIERFIIGTFTSLGWAAVCAGVTMLFV